MDGICMMENSEDPLKLVLVGLKGNITLLNVKTHEHAQCQIEWSSSIADILK